MGAFGPGTSYLQEETSSGATSPPSGAATTAKTTSARSGRSPAAAFEKSSLADVFLENTRIERAEQIPEGEANWVRSPDHSILDYCADRIFDAAQRRETEISSFIRDAVEAGETFSVIE